MMTNAGPGVAHVLVRHPPQRDALRERDGDRDQHDVRDEVGGAAGEGEHEERVGVRRADRACRPRRAGTPAAADANAESPYVAALNAPRSETPRSTTSTAAAATSAASTAYCQPNSTCADSRKTNASETRRWPCSSSGTGLASAASAAAAKAHDADHHVGGRRRRGDRRIAPTATGTVTEMTATTYRSSRGGYVWDGDVARELTWRSGDLSAAPGTDVSTRVRLDAQATQRTPAPEDTTNEAIAASARATRRVRWFHLIMIRGLSCSCSRGEATSTTAGGGRAVAGAEALRGAERSVTLVIATDAVCRNAPNGGNAGSRWK